MPPYTRRDSTHSREKRAETVNIVTMFEAQNRNYLFLLGVMNLTNRQMGRYRDFRRPTPMPISSSISVGCRSHKKKSS
jgi:hypothetical protein